MSLEEQQPITTAIVPMRGDIIENVTYLEYLFHLYIVKHFCTDDIKSKEMVSLILGPSVELMNEYKIVRYLLETYNKALLESNKSILADMQKVIEHRNIFAHWITDYSPEAIHQFKKNNVVRLVHFKRTSGEFANSLVIDVAYFSDLLKKIWDCIKFMEKVAL